MRLMEVWVKAPKLKGSKLIIVSECLRFVNEEVYKRFAGEGVVLTVCPENDNISTYGKIASIIRSSSPTQVVVVTIDGSPHCLQVHAAVNEAAYILGMKVNRKHYVLVNGHELVEISPEAVRVARYLSLVDRLIKENPMILKELRVHSMEYRLALNTGDAKLKPEEG